MYRHCPSCTRALGANEALEAFPVGRRLAFAPETGRLWVLCAHCRSWNLAPIEERWEAVEEAGRRFEAAAMGAATEHISLGCLRDGTELIRIGKAKAPELAGWRYTQRLEARWKRARRASAVLGGYYALHVPAFFFPPVAVVLASLHPWVAAGTLAFAGLDWWRLPRFRIEVATEGADFVLRKSQLKRLRLVSGPAHDDWGLELPLGESEPIRVPRALRSRALRLSLLSLNQKLGHPDHIRLAVDRTLEAGSADRLVARAARSLLDPAPGGGRPAPLPPRPRTIADADPVLRLALEISANEESERAALEGELHLLEMEWRQAEELAAISDDLLVPAWVRAWIARQRAASQKL